MEFICRYDSPIGGITLASDETAINGLWFTGQRYYAATLAENHAERETDILRQAKAWLDIYFGGAAPDFTPPLQMKTTEFRKAVWEILLTVPFGETVTYGEIANYLTEKTGTNVSPRAVGGAVGHNAISLIIPCHRVVGADGSLTGYAGGLSKKRWLLKLEGNNAACE